MGGDTSAQTGEGIWLKIVDGISLRLLSDSQVGASSTLLCLNASPEQLNICKDVGMLAFSTTKRQEEATPYL